MTFQSKGAQTPARGEMSLNSLVDQIAEAVLERLVNQGCVVSERTPTFQKAEDGNPAPASQTKEDDQTLASKIDHTLLKPDATREEIHKICLEAREYHFATVCVNSTHVGLAAELLKGSRTKAIAVVGFPLGAAATASKAFEAREAIRAGAQEIDMVINIGALKGRDYPLVFEDIRQVVAASKPYPVKVILETSSLDNDQKIIGCALSKAAGAAFVKTSTGFGAGGASIEDIALMRRVVGPEMGVKASGGIRTYEDAMKMLDAGATRIGASASVALVLQDLKKTGEGQPVENSEKKTPAKTPKSSLY